MISELPNSFTNDNFDVLPYVDRISFAKSTELQFIVFARSKSRKGRRKLAEANLIIDLACLNQSLHDHSNHYKNELLQIEISLFFF